jgi:ribosomal protein L22
MAKRYLPKATVVPVLGTAEVLQAVCNGQAEVGLIGLGGLTDTRVESCPNGPLRTQPIEGATVWFGVAADKHKLEAMHAADLLRKEIGLMSDDGTLSGIDLRWNTRVSTEAKLDYLLLRGLFMEAHATAKYIRGSAQKARLVVDLIRGKNVSEALTILRYTKKRICREVEKVLKSAVANAEQKKVIDVDKAFALLGRYDAVFGPARDGGYWLVGLKRRPRVLRPFAGVRWSSAHTLADTLANLGGRRTALVATLSDVDDARGFVQTAAHLGRRVLPSGSLSPLAGRGSG